MLSYPIDEAEELLASKLSAAKQNLANCEEDLDFLREQITVCLSCCLGCFKFERFTNCLSDYGGSYSTSLQLGCYYEAEREN
jgi:hypothetical protein